MDLTLVAVVAPDVIASPKKILWQAARWEGSAGRRAQWTCACHHKLKFLGRTCTRCVYGHVIGYFFLLVQNDSDKILTCTAQQDCVAGGFPMRTRRLETRMG